MDYWFQAIFQPDLCQITDESSCKRFRFTAKRPPWRTETLWVLRDGWPKGAELSEEQHHIPANGCLSPLKTVKISKLNQAVVFLQRNHFMRLRCKRMKGQSYHDEQIVVICSILGMAISPYWWESKGQVLLWLFQPLPRCLDLAMILGHAQGSLRHRWVQQCSPSQRRGWLSHRKRAWKKRRCLMDQKNTSKSMDITIKSSILHDLPMTPMWFAVFGPGVQKPGTYSNPNNWNRKRHGASAKRTASCQRSC